jgi:hypothetical protein
MSGITRKRSAGTLVGVYTLVGHFTFLYNRVGTQTARRDLKKLSSMELMLLDDKGKYILNFRILS